MTQPRYKDEWGTGKREGYSDIPVVNVKEVQARARQPKKQTGFLEGFGGFLMVGAFCWATFMLASNKTDLPGLLHMGVHSPIGLCGFGVVVSIVGRFFRTK